MAESTTDPDRGGSREGPRGHEAGRTDDRTVPRRVFLAMGVLVGVLAAVYAATAYEEAGTVMLILSAAFGLWFGGYLWAQQRPGPAPPAEAAPEYLPHASVWPFAIGLGAATVANGLVLGIWVTIPGLVILALGIGGFARQTRNRD